MARMKRATDGRSERCERCGGVVHARRGQTLDGVREIHLESCAGLARAHGRGPGK